MVPTGGAHAAVRDVQHDEQDLGPLAWVQAELRKTLDAAMKRLRQFASDLEDAGQSDLASPDTAALRGVRQMLHQCAGALVMVGMEQTALLPQAMEAAVHRFVQHPEGCGEAAVAVLERASFGLVEYLDNILAGKGIAPVALFPQYRQVRALAGQTNAHPVDLWPPERRAREPMFPGAVLPLPYGPEVRSHLDTAVLRIVKNGDIDAAAEMQHLCMGFAAAQQETPLRVFWKVCAGFFEALARRWLALDPYVKRAVSRVLMQYTTLARGDTVLADRLQQELLFFCAQARMPTDATGVTALRSVRNAWGLQHQAPVDYASARFGLYDPAMLAQARKRIAAATETWSALAGGDRHKIKLAADQFSLVCDSLRKLQLDSEALADALMRAVAVPLQSGQPPSAALAIEVATAVLYLQACFEELDAAREQMAERAARLAARLDGVTMGGESQPLEPWMEELYRRVSDHQTMGSVVGELRLSLAEVEKSLDEFFRDPQDSAPLGTVPGGMQQMRGVLSVLGMEEASHAVLRMRELVERLMTGDIAETERARAFERLGNSLGALGFLVDMLAYQRTMAAKLFVYDEASGELKIIMGRGDRARVDDEPDELPELLAERAPGQTLIEPGLVMSAASVLANAPETQSLPLPIDMDAVEPELPSEAAQSGDRPDAELLEIFIDEAREVVEQGLAATAALEREPGDRDEQTILRRAFHTLKGSSRMVGLAEFGEAAWAMEELLNDWLVREKPASTPLITLSTDALHALGRWVRDLGAGDASTWAGRDFRVAADALRTQGVLLDWVHASVHDDGVAQLVGARETAPAPAAAETQPMELHAPAPDFPDTVIDESLAFGTLADAEPAPEASTSRPPLLPDEDFAPTSTHGLEESDTEAAALLPGEVSDQEHAASRPQPLPEIVEGDVKAIGHLRVPTALFNVYLNEADEWSGQLLERVNEWLSVPAAPVPPDAIAAAHALAGSSATVGFAALSQLARMLEHVLQHLQLLGGAQPGQVQVISDAADEIRRLLHQFAAGFLKDATPGVLEQLDALLHAEPASAAQPQEQAAQSAELEAMLISKLKEWRESQLPHGATPAPRPQPEAPAGAGAAPELERSTDEEHVDIFSQAGEVDDAIAQALAADTDEDDIDLVDTLDPDLFPIFEEEALELLPTISGALRQWAARPEGSDARRELLRALHTLKGSARLAGALRLGEMAHRMESAVERIATEAATTADIEPLLARFDGLQATFDALRVIGAEPSTPAEGAVAGMAPVHAAAAPVLPTNEASAALAAQPLVAPAAVVRPVELAHGVARPAAGQLVRVRSQLLDRMVNDVGEVLIARSRLSSRVGQMRGSLDDLSGNLQRLRAQLRDIEVQAESQMQSRQAQSREHSAGFDPLEFDRFTRMQELTRMMAESVNDVATVQRALQRSIEGAEDDLTTQARQARELQRELLRTRMVEFDSVSERLYAVVRQAARETGKQVRLDVVGGTIEIDRGVLERMVPAFEHLLRNCVGHGIESAAVREAAGKPSVGTIVVTVGYEGNDVSVEFRDDGAGLDVERIRARAAARGLIAADAAIDGARAAELIFLPGFSTATEVTGLSGRGIGMDVVRSEVQALGGRIETVSTAGHGTSFRMVLPLTTAVTQVVMVRVGSLSIGIPANVIEMVRRVPGDELEAAYASGSYADAPLYWAGALLEASTNSTETADKARPVVLVRSASQRLALHVDEVLGNQEVVVKNLGPQLSRMPGLAGMSVLASGAVVLVYNPVALATVYGEHARGVTRPPSAALAAPPSAAELQSTVAVPLVLVVDDSITVRRVTQRLLQREGYRVALAADGLQALQQLREERPVVVLSDIEMPRMDGFDLARAIRADAKLADLPIVMITSRMAEKHKEHAIELGVSHYLGKPYSDEALLTLVRRYAEQETAARA